jgi:6-phosphogluconolactonase
MKNLRRISSVLLVLIAPLGLFGGRARSQSAASNLYRTYVGTYTSKTDSKGIYEFRFDSTTGKMSALRVAAETKDPSWVAVHPSRRFLYAANEAGKASMISAFAIEPKSGKLTLLNQLPALGEDPCHLSFDRTGKFLFVANYTSGNVAVFPILPDGKLGEHTALVEDQGTRGPNKERQEGPHAHWIAASADNRSVYVADLGLDRVLVYKFDAARGTLGPPAKPWEAKPGTGPRHVARSRDGKFLYVLGELESTVTVLANEGQAPRWLQTLAMLPAGFAARNDAAEIDIHPGGRFLYASNRGRDSIVAYAIDPRQGTLRQVEDVPTGGREPRHFAIDPTGTFLLAENQLSGTIVEFRIDPRTGRLTPTGETLELPSPVCITFLAIH